MDESTEVYFHEYKHGAGRVDKVSGSKYRATFYGHRRVSQVCSLSTLKDARKALSEIAKGAR